MPGATDTSRAIPGRWRRGVEQLRRVHSLLAATLRVSAIIEVATGCALLTVELPRFRGHVGYAAGAGDGRWCS
jgi:hypothetical protein